MALVMGTKSLLRDAIAAALSREHPAAVIEPDHEDPFGAAARHRAVVYITSSSLADGEGVSSPDRMRAALQAAHAPGVEVLVVVAPLQGYDDEIAVLKRDGIPYVVLRAPMLIEDLAGSLAGESLVVVPRDAAVRTARLRAVTDAVAAALETEDQGRTIEIAGEQLPASVAIEQAASVAGSRVWVLSIWAPLMRVIRWFGKLLGRPRRHALALVERHALPPPAHA
jgi:hypothetical protein